MWQFTAVPKGCRKTKAEKAPAEGPTHAAIRTLQDEEASLTKLGKISDRLLDRCEAWLDTYTTTPRADQEFKGTPGWVLNTYRFVGKQLLAQAEHRRKALGMYKDDVESMDDATMAKEMRRMVDHEVEHASDEQMQRWLAMRERLQMAPETH